MNRQDIAWFKHDPSLTVETWRNVRSIGPYVQVVGNLHKLISTPTPHVIRIASQREDESLPVPQWIRSCITGAAKFRCGSMSANHSKARRQPLGNNTPGGASWLILTKVNFWCQDSRNQIGFVIKSHHRDLTTSSLTDGSLPITAAYSGDANYAGSSSHPLTQTVDKGTTAVSINSDKQQQWDCAFSKVSYT